MMTFAVLLLITAVTLVALPYVRRAPSATLKIETDPPGATVYLDGRTRGVAPLRVDGLEAGRSYAVRSTMIGHKDDDQLVVAADGESSVRLRLTGLSGAVVIESDPPGAHVFVDGKDSGSLSPVTLELASGKRAEVKLHKDGFLEQTLSITGPNAGERTVYHPSLPLSGDVATLSIEVDPPNATVTVDGLALMPPSALHDTFLKPAALHHIKISAPGFIDFRDDVTLGGGEHKTIKAHLGEGGVLALKTNVVARVFIDDKAVGTCPLAPLALTEGKHTLQLKAERPYLRYSATVSVEKGKTIEHRLDFGTVEVKAPGITAQTAGGPEGMTMLQLPAGPQKLALSNKDTGEKREREVVVAPGGKVVIDAW